MLGGAILFAGSSHQLPGQQFSASLDVWLRKLGSQRLRGIGQGQARLTARSDGGHPALNPRTSAAWPRPLPHHPPATPLLCPIVRRSTGTAPSKSRNKIDSHQPFLYPIKETRNPSRVEDAGRIERGGTRDVAAHAAGTAGNDLMGCPWGQTARRADRTGHSATTRRDQG